MPVSSQVQQQERDERPLSRGFQLVSGPRRPYQVTG